MSDDFTERRHSPPCRDAEMHRKVDLVARQQAEMLEFLQGNQMRGIAGLAAEHRSHGEQINGIHERLERHSRRLLALETIPMDRARWTARTVAEKGIGALVAGLVGALAALMAGGHAK
jgi:hypothetical protein